jgi:hypothetical protein
MNTETKKANFNTRDALLKLLSEDEVARLSTNEAGPRLPDGDEYVDLEQIRKGVQRVLPYSIVRMGHVLPRSEIRAETWRKICARLAEGLD